MPKRLILFFSILLSLLILLIYSTYLVDWHLVTLKAVFKKLAKVQTLDDLHRLNPFLKAALLQEISQKTFSPEALVYLEIAENISGSAKIIQQLDDVKFFLGSVIKLKDKSRPKFLSFLDHFHSFITRPTITFSLRELEVKASELLSKTDPQSEVFLKTKFNLAWIYKLNKEYEKALSYFTEVSEVQGKPELSITSLYEIADVWYKKGAYQITRYKYEELVSLYPKFALADLALYMAGCISFYHFNDMDTALKYFLELEEKFPQTEISRYARSRKRVDMVADLRSQGYKLIKEKKYTEAMDNFKKATEVAPGDVSSLNGMALCYYWKDQKGEALNEVKKALRIAPQDEAGLINSLFVNVNSGQIDEALEIAQGFISEKKLIQRAEVYYNLGYTYALKAQMDKAIIQFERAIVLNPDFVFTYNNLGCAFWTIGKFSEAIEMFKRAVALDPEYVDAHFNLGIAYFYLKRLEEAYARFKQVLKLDPNYQKAEEYISTIVEILKYEP